MYEVTYPQKEKNDGYTMPTNEQFNNENVCSICWDAPRDCLIMPCRHNVSCTKCVKSVKNCPICRSPITDLVIIYKS